MTAVHIVRDNATLRQFRAYNPEARVIVAGSSCVLAERITSVIVVGNPTITDFWWEVTLLPRFVPGGVPIFHLREIAPVASHRTFIAPED